MVQSPLAIIGIGCRFPNIHNHHEFWDCLQAGKAITQRQVPHRESFDADFFGISPQAAALMDPQQRLLLEVSWETFEDAGILPTSLAGSQTGIFVGANDSEYAQQLDQQSQQQFEFTVGNRTYIAANRLSNFYDLCGVSLVLNTACSSGLMAVDRACRSLWTGESDLALAGGVNLVVDPLGTIRLQQGGLIAKDGHCKVFDQQADGYGRSEGVGFVLLKSLAQAEADQNHIYAVIRGSSTNHNGRSNGLTAPNLQAQIQLLTRAYKDADIQPQAVSYVETHATGTTIGDALELKAIGKVLGKGRSPEQPCWVGSVKTNIGHTETASGIAGLIKTALMLHHGQMPQHLHVTEPNTAVKFKKLNLAIPQTLQALVPTTEGEAIYVGVSAFGLGGANVHTILSAPAIAPPPSPRPSQVSLKFSTYLFLLSAKSAPALQALARHYQDLCQTQPDFDLGALCCAVNTTRTPFTYRLGIIASSLAELQQELTHYLAGEKSDRLLVGQVSKRQRKKQLLPVIQEKLEINSLEQLAEEAVINPQELSQLLVELGTLWLAGSNFDWRSLYPQHQFLRGIPRVNLPTYPFQRQRYWLAKTMSTVAPPQSSSQTPPAAIAKALTAMADNQAEFLPPRTDLEKQLIESWQEVLEVKDIGVKDNFFALGGNSLRSRQLALRIENKLKLNYRLPISALYELSTVAEQAKLIAAPDPAQTVELLASPLGDRLTLEEYKNCLAIVTGRPGKRPHIASLINSLNPQGDRQPLFFCANGYKESLPLQQTLGEEQPFHLVESGLSVFHYGIGRQIRALAAHHVQDILKIQTEPPYAICGYSFGTFVAYEIAQQLTQLGKEVNALIILDHVGRNRLYWYKHDLWYGRFWHKRLEALEKRMQQAGLLHQTSLLPRDVLPTKPIDEAETNPQVNPQRRSPTSPNAESTSEVNPEMEAPYEYQEYNQPFYFFVARDEVNNRTSMHKKVPVWLSPRMGWPAATVSRYQVQLTSGDHFSMLRSPHVEDLAKRLQEILQPKTE